MGHCTAGNHSSLHAFEYDGKTWCPEHRPPSGPHDPPTPGICALGNRGPHKAEHVNWLPVMGRHVCRRHMAILIREVIQRGEYGRG
jgi:hypothetical protein